MRWLLGRDPGSCEACGAELERGAAWCGACGARTDGAGADGADQVAAAESDAPEDDAHVGVPWWSHHRQWVVAALVLGVVAIAVAVQPPDGPAEPLLGQLGQQTGMSATGPPPAGLRLAWAHDPPGGGNNRMLSGPPQRIMVRDDKVTLGSHVVDLESGRLVRVSVGGAAPSAEWAMVEAGELVVIDTVTGEVRHRAAASGDWLHRNPWSIGRWDGVSLFGSERGSVLVGDDGAVIAEVDGGMRRGIDRALGTPAAIPVRPSTPGHFDDQFTAPVRLVAIATGEVLLDLDDDRVRIADVVGDLAMIAETDARIDAVTSPAATSEVPWTVRLLNARTGEERARLDVDSHEPPRLLGTFADGTAVVAARAGDEFPLLAVAPDGSASTIARAQPPPRRTGTGMWAESTSLNAAAVTDDVLVVSAGDDGVVGLDGTGRVLWTLDASTFAGLRADGGHLAVLPDDDGGRIRVVRAADGEGVASLPTRAPRWDVANTPRAALAGHVGLGSGDSFFAREEVLGATTWLDLRTGEQATLEDVFGPFLPVDAAGGVDRSWLLHGTVAPEVGADAAQASGVEEDGIEPVLTRFRPGSVLEVLEPREGFTQFSLPIPERAEVFDRGIRPIGATADRLAVWREGFDTPGQMAVHVLDRRTGDVTTTEGLHGIALVGDVVLAAEIDEDWTTASLVGLDAATGQQRWSGPPLEAFRGRIPPRVDRELVVDVGVARVSARSLRDGGQVWSHASDAELTDHSALGPRHVVVATTTGEVVALDRDDGDIAWRTAVGTPIASLTGAGDHVLVGTHDGLVVHLDGRGREVQRLVVGSGPVEAVAALGDTVVATVDERVVGLRADGTGITRDDEVDLP